MEGPRSRSSIREARAADGSRSIISRNAARKELAKQLRREAYQKAKAQRAADPKHQAMKEAAKARRRELYQQVKERRKAGEAEEKAARSAQRSEERAARRASFATQIKSALEGPASEGGLAVPALQSRTEAEAARTEAEAAPGSEDVAEGLESEVQAALGNRRVSELLQRLRRVSDEPGVTANEAEPLPG